MKKPKLNRNIFIFNGFCFLLITILQLSNFQITHNKIAIVPIFSAIACILMFINAYIYHKKMIKDSKD
jgi:uncharacterized membrane protein